MALLLSQRFPWIQNYFQVTASNISEKIAYSVLGEIMFCQGVYKRLSFSLAPEKTTELWKTSQVITQLCHTLEKVGLLIYLSSLSPILLQYYDYQI